MTRARIDALAGALRDRGLPALLVSGAANIRYLTGFSGSNALVSVRADGGGVLLTDFRYLERAAPAAALLELRRARRDLVATAAEDLPGLVGGDRAGFEAAHLTVARHRALAGAGVELVPTEGIVERLRAVKDAGELEAVRAAAAPIADVLAALASEGFAGRAEADVAWRIHELMHEHGADAVSFPPVVAAGANGALPHAEPGAAPIEPGTLVTVDLGARRDGYCSDCTRTFALGEPPADLREIYGLCLEAQLAGLAAIRPGVRCADVDAAARDVIAGAGMGDAFGHGLGHGVGMEVHEAPRLAPRQDAVLEAGMVVTVEPGIYLPGRGGVRIEDLVVVTGDGAERLTPYPKELAIVG